MSLEAPRGPTTELLRKEGARHFVDSHRASAVLGNLAIILACFLEVWPELVA